MISAVYVCHSVENDPFPAQAQLFGFFSGGATPAKGGVGPVGDAGEPSRKMMKEGT